MLCHSPHKYSNTDGTSVAPSPVKTSFDIIDRQTGPRQKTVYIVVPETASESDLLKWAAALEKSEKEPGKDIMLNFYHNWRGTDNMIATYQGGHLYKTK